MAFPGVALQGSNLELYTTLRPRMPATDPESLKEQVAYPWNRETSFNNLGVVPFPFPCNFTVDFSYPISIGV